MQAAFPAKPLHSVVSRSRSHNRHRQETDADDAGRKQIFGGRTRHPLGRGGGLRGCFDFGLAGTMQRDPVASRMT